MGADHRLYGTTRLNGPLDGTVFSLNTDGNEFLILRSFISTAGEDDEPGPLIEGSTGDLFGATSHSIFRLSKDGGHYELLHSFRVLPGDGAFPTAIIQTRDGTLYGMTAFGGSNSAGIIFRMDPTGSDYRILYRFSSYLAPGELIDGTDGFLYGTTYFGGSFDSGTVFRMGKDGSNYSIVYNFSPVNRGPRDAAGILEGNDGALYLPTTYGGLMDLGTLCRMVPPPQISGLRVLADRRTRVTVLALSGQQIRVERSADLLNWAIVGSATSVNGNVILDDPNSANLRYQFYRALVE